MSPASIAALVTPVQTTVAATAEQPVPGTRASSSSAPTPSVTVPFGPSANVTLLTLPGCAMKGSRPFVSTLTSAARADAGSRKTNASATAIPRTIASKLADGRVAQEQFVPGP